MEFKRPDNIRKSSGTKNFGAVSQLVYSSSNVVVPHGAVDLVRMKYRWSRRLTVQFRFLKDPLKQFSYDSSVGQRDWN